MKRLWQILAARIDDMPLRQRGLVFATVSLVIAMVAHAAFLDPMLSTQRSLLDRVNRDQSQLVSVRAQIGAVIKEQEGSVDNPESRALRELEQKVVDVEKSLAERKQAFIAPARLPPLLTQLLGPSGAVKMESLKVMPGAPVTEATEFHRHGVEVVLRGSYFDLTKYLADLETLPVHLLWGRVELQADGYPEVRMTLQVHTLGTQRTLGL